MQCSYQSRSAYTQTPMARRGTIEVRIFIPQYISALSSIWAHELVEVPEGAARSVGDISDFLGGIGTKGGDVIGGFFV